MVERFETLDEEIEGKPIIVMISYYMDHHHIGCSPASFSFIRKLIEENKQLKDEVRKALDD